MVELELADGISAFRWQAMIGFSPAPIRYPLLGTAGCLQYFNTKFRGEDRIVEIDATLSYPGTIS
jgi:hypothetical protein